jgi:hypothetical protein
MARRTSGVALTVGVPDDVPSSLRLRDFGSRSNAIEGSRGLPGRPVGASQHFEAARTAWPWRAASRRLMSLRRTEDAKSLEAALTRIDEAQRAAGQLNQDANALAADAAETIGDVLGRIPKR